MEVDSVAVAGVKGAHGEYNLDRVNLITGKNSSRKTAVLASLQACLGGSVDGVGGSNANLGLLADRSTGRAKATVVADDVVANVEITLNKGRSSVVRSMRRGDVDLDLKASAVSLFGKVPQSVGELWDLTAEELWQVMLPSGGEASIPESIKTGLIEEAGINPNDLKGDDPASLSEEALEAVKACLSEANKKLKEMQAQVSADTASYDGPPEDVVETTIAELEKKIAAHKNAIEVENKHAKAKTKLKEQIDKAYADRESKTKLLAEKNQAMGEVNTLAEELRELAKIPELQFSTKLIPIGRTFLSAATDAYTSLDDSPLKTSVNKTIEVAEQFLAYASALGRLDTSNARYIAAEIASEQGKKLGFTYSPTDFLTNDGVQRAMDSVKIGGESLQNSIKSLENELEGIRLNLAKIEPEYAELEAQEVLIVPQEEFTQSVGLLGEFKAHRSVLDGIKRDMQARALVAPKMQEMASKIEDLNKLEISIKEWREGLVAACINTMQHEANGVLNVLGMSGVVITPKVGKRSQVTICNTDGVDIRVFSGSERVAYGVAIIHAMQVVRNVKLPIIYIEGGELDQDRLNSLLSAMVMFRKSGNVIVAHYLDTPVAQVNRILVDAEVASV